MEEPILITPSELKRMFTNLVNDTLKRPEKYQNGNGIEDYLNKIRNERILESKRRNSLDLLDNSITFGNATKTCLGEICDEEEESEELSIKRKCYVVMKAVSEKYFTLEDALKIYNVSSGDYEIFLKSYEVL